MNSEEENNKREDAEHSKKYKTKYSGRQRGKYEIESSQTIGGKDLIGT